MILRGVWESACASKVIISLPPSWPVEAAVAAGCCSVRWPSSLLSPAGGTSWDFSRGGGCLASNDGNGTHRLYECSTSERNPRPLLFLLYVWCARLVLHSWISRRTLLHPTLLKAESPYLGDARALEGRDPVIQVYFQHPESFTVLLWGYTSCGFLCPL